MENNMNSITENFLGFIAVVLVAIAIGCSMPKNNCSCDCCKGKCDCFSCHCECKCCGKDGSCTLKGDCCKDCKCCKDCGKNKCTC